MELYDNGKLVGLLQKHGVQVLEVQPHSIVVNTLYAINGKREYKDETINASMPSVLNYLGY